MIYLFFLLLKRAILFSLVFCVLLKGLPHLMERGSFASVLQPAQGPLTKTVIDSDISRSVCWAWNTLTLFLKLTAFNVLFGWFGFFSLLGHTSLSRIGHTLNLLFGRRKQSALCNAHLPWAYKRSFWLKICFLAQKVYLLLVEIRQLPHAVILSHTFCK